MNVKAAPLLVTLLLLLPSAGSAQLASKILGNDGVVFEVRTGAYGTLFPEVGADVAAPVLALDVHGPNGSTRLLVPTTDDPAAEVLPRVFFDKRSGLLDLLWLTHTPAGASEIRGVRFDGNGWSDPDTLYHHDAGVVPRVAITHGSYQVELPDGSASSADRVVLHLFWRDLGDDGAVTVFYSPVVFVQGVYIGWRDAVSLDDLAGAGTGSEASLPEALADVLTVQISDDHKAVNVVFGSARIGDLRSLQIGIPPLELSLLGAAVRDVILASPFAAGDLSFYAGGMGAMIIHTGLRMGLDPAIVEYVAAAVTAQIAASGGDEATLDPYALAGDMQAFADALTASLFGTTLPAPADGSAPELDVRGLVEDSASQATARMIELRAIADRGAPPTTLGADVQVLASDDGRDVLLRWLDAGGRGLWYVESIGGSWSEPRLLATGPELSLDEARELLLQRIR